MGLLISQHEEATINGFTMVCDMAGWTMTHMTHFERREPQIFAAMLQVGEARGGGGNYPTLHLSSNSKNKKMSKIQWKHYETDTIFPFRQRPRV